MKVKGHSPLTVKVKVVSPLNGCPVKVEVCSPLTVKVKSYFFADSEGQSSFSTDHADGEGQSLFSIDSEGHSSLTAKVKVSLSGVVTSPPLKKDNDG